MTNEEIIEELNDLLEGTIDHFDLEDAMDMLYDVKAILKKANKEPKTEWIPVSERLPVKEGYYLTTTMYHEVFCDYWNSESFERTETVIAWCELPKPYKESEG